MSAELEEEVEDVKDKKDDGCSVREDQDIFFAVLIRCFKDRVELCGVSLGLGAKEGSDILWLG